MTNDNRDIFAARLRHELTQETHVVVGDHPPEPRCIGKRRTLGMGYGSGALHNMEKYATRIGSARTGNVEYKMEPIPRDIAERQLDLYSFALTGGPRLPDVVIQDEHIFYGADEELAAIDGAAFHPLGDPERDRQYAKLTALPVNQLTEAPVDSPICKCHDRMGNDWYFLPSGDVPVRHQRVHRPDTEEDEVRERLCQWANCTITSVKVTVNNGEERPAFCSACHAALWLLNGEGHVKLAREIEQQLSPATTR